MPKDRSSLLRNRSLATTACCVVVAVAVASCGTGTTAPDDGRKRVVTTFTVLADMVRAVAGPAVSVESITKPGAEVHGYQPTPSDLLTSAKADLVMDNGLGLESWFAQFVERSEAPHVTLSEGVRPIAIRSGQQRGKANPHAWMSPHNGTLYVTNIRDALTRLDPAHAELFRRNAAAYTLRIQAISDSLRTALGTVPRHHRALVTCEGAFSYLARDAGLREAYLWPVNSDEQGTPQQIKDTTLFVRQHRVPTVFCESTVSDEAQRQVARDAGARLGRELYVDSLSDAGGPVPSYLGLLRHDADSIAAGLAGTRR